MKVKDICDLQNGRAFKPEDWGTEGLPIIRIQNLNDENAPFNYYSGDYNPVHEVNDGELLFSWSGTPGTSFGAFRWYRGKGVLNQHIFRVLPKIEVDKEYLKYALNGNINAIIAKAHGGVGLQHITKKELDEIDIPIVPIEEQFVIVSKIVRAERIIAMRKQELQKLDELIKARFVEMFGDRWKNDKGWNQTTLNESATFYNGKAHEQVIDEDGRYILVTSRCIASDMTDYRRTNAILFPLQVGDICMVMSDVPNGKALAKCVSIEENDVYTLNQRICCFRDYKLNPVFFYYLLNRHEYLLSFDNGDSQTNLRKNDLLACPVICPPMELQEQFAEFVKQLDKSKVAAQKALEEAQLLFDSLMQKYFG